MPQLQELLNKMREERNKLPINTEWDRCYHEIELLVINNFYSITRGQQETLYTEEQVREAISKSVSILVGQEINLAQLKELIIQLLKQPKKD